MLMLLVRALTLRTTALQTGSKMKLDKYLNSNANSLN